MGQIKKLFYLWLVLLLFGCGRSEITMKVINNSDFNLNEVSIGIMSNEQMVKRKMIPSQETETMVLNMKRVAQTDGHYVISYGQNGKSQSIEFGYFTNGHPLEEQMILIIKNDTIMLQPEVQN